MQFDFPVKKNDAKLTLLAREKTKFFVDEKWPKLLTWPTWSAQYKVHQDPKHLLWPFYCVDHLFCNSPALHLLVYWLTMHCYWLNLKTVTMIVIRLIDFTLNRWCKSKCAKWVVFELRFVVSFFGAVTHFMQMHPYACTKCQMRLNTSAFVSSCFRWFSNNFTGHKSEVFSRIWHFLALRN